jgi:hypothetical protein
MAGIPAIAHALPISCSTVLYPGSTFTLLKGVNDNGEFVGE